MGDLPVGEGAPWRPDWGARSEQVHPVFQQLLPGSAGEAEGGVLGAGEAGAACRGAQLLEVGLLDGAAAGKHGRGRIPGGAREGGPVLPPGPRAPRSSRTGQGAAGRGEAAGGESWCPLGRRGWGQAPHWPGTPPRGTPQGRRSPASRWASRVAQRVLPCPALPHPALRLDRLLSPLLQQTDVQLES